MKAILISIKPSWVAKILNGEKTIEIRKTLPKCDFPIDVYIYVTKEYDKCLWYKQDSKMYVLNYGKPTSEYLNGKVVAKFTLNKVDKIGLRFERYCAGELSQDGLLKYSCLTEQELDDYLFPNCCIGYAWHIDNLVVFNKPMELNKFLKTGFEKEEQDILYAVDRKTRREYKKEIEEKINCVKDGYRLTRPPQSWYYVETKKE